MKKSLSTLFAGLFLVVWSAGVQSADIGESKLGETKLGETKLGGTKENVVPTMGPISAVDMSTTDTDAINLKKKKPNGILYKLKSNSSLQAEFNIKRQSIRSAETTLDARLMRHGIRHSRALKRKNRASSRSIFHASLTDSAQMSSTLEKLRNDPNVEWAEENIIY